MRHWIVVPAAGAGRRLGGGLPKQYLDLVGAPVIRHTLRRLLLSRPTAVVVVLAAGDEHWPRLIDLDDPRILTTQGGAERIDSVRAGLALLAGRAAPEDPVLVHDAVRPCVMPTDIAALLAADHPQGAVLAAPVADTLKRVDAQGRIIATEARAGLWAAQTPQLCRYGVLVAALAEAQRRGREITDEAAALEAAGLQPRVVHGRRDNIKITWPGDLALAAAILAAQEEA
ncbi:MAG TPA: 2-C-methyl-D-erythritol 4-phosphate cytidylyltransferase [Porticoccaceae bacterium]|nr:2-C-methyl-D-erythritol 4-phosphate cytidylyltransferase [Porticoccaceae bacterium]